MKCWVGTGGDCGPSPPRTGQEVATSAKRDMGAALSRATKVGLIVFALVLLMAIAGRLACG